MDGKLGFMGDALGKTFCKRFSLRPFPKTFGSKGYRCAASSKGEGVLKGI